MHTHYVRHLANIIDIRWSRPVWGGGGGGGKTHQIAVTQKKFLGAYALEPSYQSCGFNNHFFLYKKININKIIEGEIV